MKVLVCVKRVVDYNVRVRVKADGSGIATEGVKHSMNPFDEIAVEEAVRWKEKGVAVEVVAVTIGGDAALETLRTALAMGADRAIHVHTEEAVQNLAAAKLLREVAAQEQPRVVLLGKQAIDDDAAQTGPMLAGLLGWPQATFASKIDFEGEEAHVTREVDGGLMTLRLRLPAVITTDLRLNTPRYPALPSIMKAKAKPVARREAAAAGVDIRPRITRIRVEEPPARKPGIMVKDVAELVERLRHEAKVIE
ncbi:MAG: electron transfer flavoprotein subunit beta/FixA family protein [Alphaproteobacteria bacterium]|nr:electron transfer flavoprotein subunit beta/FixA family protein [Alphaproteobacteria bacterium]